MCSQELDDAEQAWFRRDAWQAGEREASEDISASRTTRSTSAEEFVKELVDASRR